MRSKKTYFMKSCHAGWSGAIVLMLLVSLFAGQLFVFAQTPPKKPEPQQGMGVSTGTPVNYSSRRTVGVTDSKAPVVFEDVTDKTAMANFRHRAGSPQKNYIFETPSGGVAIFDYDGDGLQWLNGRRNGRQGEAAAFRALPQSRQLEIRGCD
jgi:hypothetical protein